MKKYYCTLIKNYCTIARIPGKAVKGSRRRAEGGAAVTAVLLQQWPMAVRR